MTKWQVVLEVRLQGEPDAIEVLLNGVMEQLVDSGIEDPGIGATLASGVASIEYVVQAPSLFDAQRIAHEIGDKALGLPPSDFIGESTRRAELVPV